MWTNKHVVLGVTGGIAAYKAIDLANKLTKEGAIVDTILTPNALQFVTKLSFSAVTGREVYTDMFQSINKKIAHIELAKADMIIMAPATKNEIAKLAYGICDNLLLDTIAASDSNVYIAPAMNTKMYLKESTTDALNKLISYGYKIIPPKEGILACKEVGIGKLADIDEIIRYIETSEKSDNFFNDKRVILTGGPTISKLDPVRVFTNRSSGKMASEISKELKLRGAKVTYISHIDPRINNTSCNEFIKIDTTDDMYEAIIREIKDNDILIMCAAPLDFEFSSFHNEKIKKDGEMEFKLVRTKDILTSLKDELKDKKVIGFAAETENHEKNAMDKLKRKNMDYIVLNDVSSNIYGMGSDMNAGYVFSKKGSKKMIRPMTKRDMAKEILDFVEEEEKCL